MTDLKTEFQDRLAANLPKIAANDEQIERFFTLAELLVSVNKTTNLTAITDQSGIITKHFIDSIACIQYIPNGAKLIDIGSGAGFPALPIAIMRPDVTVTALDSTGKKTDFIKLAANECRLDNVNVICARAEEVASDAAYREKFDIAVSRAVARLNVLCELCIPFVRCGGVFVALKAESARVECNEAQSAFRRLGCYAPTQNEFKLNTPDGDENRTIVTAQKQTHTPKQYPRRFAQIKKSPL